MDLFGNCQTASQSGYGGDEHRSHPGENTASLAPAPARNVVTALLSGTFHKQKEGRCLAFPRLCLFTSYVSVERERVGKPRKRHWVLCFCSFPTPPPTPPPRAYCLPGELESPDRYTRVEMVPAHLSTRGSHCDHTDGATLPHPLANSEGWTDRCPPPLGTLWKAGEGSRFLFCFKLSILRLGEMSPSSSLERNPGWGVSQRDPEGAGS